MLTLYVATLILGLGLLAVQLLGSGGAGADGDAALPPGGADGTALGTEIVPSSPPDDADGMGLASIFLSLRFYMFAALGSGPPEGACQAAERISSMRAFVSGSFTAILKA